MTDASQGADPSSPVGLTRRQVLAAAVSGGLLGSAWTVAFREASSSDSVPTVTVARDGQSLCTLIEYRGCRLLLLYGSSDEPLLELTELTTGVTRQRIDMLLATSATLSTLPVTFRSRWQIQDVRSLPDSDQYPQLSIAGHELRVDEMSVAADRVVSGEWSRPSNENGLGWYLTVRFRESRIVVASRGDVLEHIGPDAGTVTGVICSDSDIPRWPASLSASMLLAPTAAELFSDAGDHPDQLLVPFHQRFPMTFRLTGEGIEPPASW